MDLEAGQADAPRVQQAIHRTAQCSAHFGPICAAVAALVAIVLFGLWFHAHFPDGLLWRNRRAAAPAPEPLYRTF